MSESSDLREALRRCPNLPTSPQAAKDLIQLFESPSPEVDDIVKILAKDSALTVKILQLANSSFFPYKYQVTTLSKAAILIGYNGILATALSFTLVQHLRKEGAEGLNLDLFWRRSLLAASICRAIGESCERDDVEELFLTGLIQDIGMLALERLKPEVYASRALNQFSHSAVIAHEREVLGVDHALAGSWLLTDWNFPSKLCVAVQLSDELEPFPPAGGSEEFYNCVTFSVMLTELFVNQSSDEAFLDVVDFAQQRLGIDALSFANTLKKVKGIVKETELLFDMKSQSDASMMELSEKARVLLAQRNAQLAVQLDAMFLQNAASAVG